MNLSDEWRVYTEKLYKDLSLLGNSIIQSRFKDFTNLYVKEWETIIKSKKSGTSFIDDNVPSGEYFKEFLSRVFIDTRTKEEEEEIDFYNILVTKDDITSSFIIKNKVKENAEYVPSIEHMLSFYEACLWILGTYIRDDIQKTMPVKGKTGTFDSVKWLYTDSVIHGFLCMIGKRFIMSDYDHRPSKLVVPMRWLKSKNEKQIPESYEGVGKIATAGWINKSNGFIFSALLWTDGMYPRRFWGKIWHNTGEKLSDYNFLSIIKMIELDLQWVKDRASNFQDNILSSTEPIKMIEEPLKGQIGFLDLDEESKKLDYTLAEIMKIKPYVGGKRGEEVTTPVKFDFIENITTGEWLGKTTSSKSTDPFETWGKVLWKLAHYSLYDDSSSILRRTSNDESPIPSSWFVTPAIKEEGGKKEKLPSIWESEITMMEYRVTTFKTLAKVGLKPKEERKYISAIRTPSLDFGQWLRQLPPWTLWILTVFYSKYIPYHLIQTMSEIEDKEFWIPKVIPFTV